MKRRGAELAVLAARARESQAERTAREIERLKAVGVIRSQKPEDQNPE
jgi:hypothetical protein